MSRLLVFHPALAPYRRDFFNALGQRFDLRAVFFLRNNLNQGFNQNDLLKDATYSYGYLDRTFTVGGHRVNLGHIKEINCFRPDTVITSEYGFSTITAYLYKKILHKSYRILTICDDSEDIARNASGMRGRLRRYFAKRLEGIICVSPKVADIYRSWGCRNPIVFPIIRSERLFEKEKHDTRRITGHHIETWKLADRINILFVGRLAKVKNLSGLLSTFGTLPEEYREKCNIVIVGDGQEKDNLRAQARHLGIDRQLVLPGKFEGQELMAWYGAGSFFILPSTYEPFGAVTAEALMSGSPVMISDKAGSAWLVDNDKSLTFDPDSEQDFREKLMRMIDRSSPTPPEGHERQSLLPCSFQELIAQLTENLSEKPSE